MFTRSRLVLVLVSAGAAGPSFALNCFATVHRHVVEFTIPVASEQPFNQHSVLGQEGPMSGYTKIERTDRAALFDSLVPGDRLMFSDYNRSEFSMGEPAFRAYTGHDHRYSVLAVEGRGKSRRLRVLDLDSGVETTIATEDLLKVAHGEYLYSRKGAGSANYFARRAQFESAYGDHGRGVMNIEFAHNAADGGYRWLSESSLEAGRAAESKVYDQLNLGDDLVFINRSTGLPERYVYSDIEFGVKQFTNPATGNQISLTPSEFSERVRPNSLCLAQNNHPLVYAFDPNISQSVQLAAQARAAIASAAAGQHSDGNGIVLDPVASQQSAGTFAALGVMYAYAGRQRELTSIKAQRGLQFNVPYDAKRVTKADANIQNLSSAPHVMTIHRTPELGPIERTVTMGGDPSVENGFKLRIRARDRNEAAQIFSELAESTYGYEVANFAPVAVSDTRMDLSSWTSDGRLVSRRGAHRGELNEINDGNPEGNVELTISFGKLPPDWINTYLRSFAWGHQIRRP